MGCHRRTALTDSAVVAVVAVVAAVDVSAVAVGLGHAVALVRAG